MAETRARPAERPLSPHVQIYRWPVTMGTSILHRITGFGLALGIWLIGRYSVSVAYPIVVGLSLVMLAAISALALGEMLTPLKLAGTGLIVAGVAVLTRPGTPSVSGV